MWILYMQKKRNIPVQTLRPPARIIPSWVLPRSEPVKNAIMVEVKPHLAALQNARKNLQKAIDESKVGLSSVLSSFEKNPFQGVENAIVFVSVYYTFQLFGFMNSR